MVFAEEIVSTGSRERERGGDEQKEAPHFPPLTNSHFRGISQPITKDLLYISSASTPETVSCSSPQEDLPIAVNDPFSTQCPMLKFFTCADITH